MRSIDVVICNKLGLHARAAAKLVSLANGYSASITLDKAGQQVNGKSIMGVMMLAASKGTTLTLSADGTDEHAAIEAICALIDARFGEDE
jgi:phosphocarrier protein HPr